MPAKPGNQNALKHGGRSARAGIALATLGRKYTGVYLDVARLRKAIEHAIQKQRGAITLVEQSRLQTLCRHELSCRVAEKMLRDDPKMPVNEVLKLRSLVAQWSAQKDRIMGELLGAKAGKGLDDPGSIYLPDPDELDAEPVSFASGDVGDDLDGSGIGLDGSDAADATTGDSGSSGGEFPNQEAGGGSETGRGP